MADFIPGDLTDHTLDVSCPGVMYSVRLYDDESAERIDNATGFTVTWDGSTYPLSATLTLTAEG